MPGRWAPSQMVMIGGMLALKPALLAMATCTIRRIGSMVPVRKVGDDHISARTRWPAPRARSISVANRSAYCCGLTPLPTGSTMRRTISP